MKCYLCPRKCGVDRAFKKGYCGCGNSISIRRAQPHYWEEPCISGTKGSGTVFFEGCQLHCIFCQNYKISDLKYIDKANADSVTNTFSLNETDKKEKLKEIFYSLEKQGVHNINLVTPDPHIPMLIPAIKEIKAEGFSLPFIMNCSGYETPEMINSLEGIIDVYLPDFKYFSPLLGKKYSSAPDYPDVAKKAIDIMIKQQPKIVFDENGLIKNGVIVRHMMIPKNLHDSKKVISYLYETYKDSIYISIMNQYTPLREHKFNELNEKVSSEEYTELIDFALSIGIKKAYIQEGEAARESFVPAFSESSII